jgi:class 3 adenylate cyclase
MGLKDELTSDVRKIFREVWSERDGQKVPEVEDVKLGNDSVKIEATVLYADLADSTKLVDGHDWKFAAEVYKTYLHCASKIIKNEDGVITAFDGDRVMAVFFDGAKNTNAVRAGLKLKWAVANIIKPALKAQYQNKSYEVRQVVGIDTSVLHVARTGVWGDNDLVWVGRAANYAAKLSSINEPGYFTFITETVYNNMLDDGRLNDNGADMWERRIYCLNGLGTYRSKIGWTIH